MKLDLVYFVKPIGMDGPIKIGCSNSPANRLLALMVWSPWPLEIVVTVPGDVALEKNIHECFADSHSHREWFHSTPILRDAIERIKAGVPVQVAIDLNARQGSIRTTAQKRRVVLSEDQRRYRSMNSRLGHAERRGGKILDAGWLSAPADVDEIMMRWRGKLGAPSGLGTPPTEQEYTRLVEVVTHPEIHCLRPARRETAEMSPAPDLQSESAP